MKGFLLSAALGVVLLAAAASLPSGRAEACSRGFRVFFGERSDEITERGSQMLDEFVRYFRYQRTPTENEARVGCGPLPPGDYRVLIRANADDPGTRDQCALSLARGHAVRARLALLGIPEAFIAVESFGDRRRLVSWRDGTRDAQNRSVEIEVVATRVVEERSPYPRLRDRPDRACPEESPGK
ncbi:hypothetical protein ACE7GA_04535 [Roseomonas sp. CCTCC AB2023176]|uniref:hypothetical protein n=1 Tax=Roseomonas sp. CCTCC AB2023176 TaxID=3342640 RepID=UPI0035D7DCFE